MAKKSTKIEEVQEENINNEIEEVVVENKEEVVINNSDDNKSENKGTNNGPTYDELLSIVQQLAGEITSLKQNQNCNQTSFDNNSTMELINILANRKSDKEVTIIHNCELIGGLSTHIDLTGMTIDFRTIGEQRVLSWQQFEECVSKYRSFFERNIILLSDEHYDLSVKYSIPCVKRGDNHVITHEEILKLEKYTPEQLDKLVRSLTKKDQDFVFSYWLGQCYKRTPGFYDRHKVELLNLISGEHVFDNLITLMNGDYRNGSENN